MVNGEKIFICSSVSDIRGIITDRLARYANDPEARILAYTQTFKSVHSKRPMGQFRETAPYLTKLLDRAADFIIVPEWRDTNGSIHYHGILILRDRYKWQKSTLPSLKCLGFVLIKPIDNMVKWIEYFIKDALLAEQLVLTRMPIYSVLVIKKKKNKVFTWDGFIEESLIPSEAEESSNQDPDPKD